ncbi:MAG: hypothetical protein WA702_16585 [Bradyrhizobium sp.]|uniref:hypothetical protein n=1 Tax=Bradyrhizobium sp. TaxID=376 RepID=UPI003C7C1124
MREISEEDRADKAELMQALETAIAGVEAHAKKYGRAGLAPPNTTRLEALGAKRSGGILRAIETAADQAGRGEGLTDALSDRGITRAIGQRSTSAMPMRFAAVLLCVACVAVGVVVVKRRDFRSSALRPVTSAASAVPVVAGTPQVAPPMACPRSEPADGLWRLCRKRGRSS